MRSALFVAILSVPTLAPVAAQFADETRHVTRGGTTAAEFLSIPVGARATAMGSAYSASVNDPTALYWNPAGLGLMDQVTIAAENADWLAGIAFNYAAVAVPMRWGTVGASVTSFATRDMHVTTVMEQEGTGERFDAASYALALAYGANLTDRFSFGMAAKVITERIWHSTATGLAMDAGTVFTTPFWGIRFGASISNFGTKMRMTGDDLIVVADIDPLVRGNNESNRAELKTDAFDLPLTMRIGLAGEVVESDFSRLTLAVDVLSPNNSDQFVNAGAEIGLLGDMIMIRGGFSEVFLRSSVRSWALGGGLRYDFYSVGFALDYAYEAQEYFGGVSRMTAGVRF